MFWRSLLASLLCGTVALAGDWPQWGHDNSRNMVASDKGLPDTFDPGKPADGKDEIDPATMKNVKATLRSGRRIRDWLALHHDERLDWLAVPDFLRNTLLSGVSHELRTPLAAITGAAGTIIQANGNLSAKDSAEMLETAERPDDT